MTSQWFARVLRTVAGLAVGVTLVACGGGGGGGGGDVPVPAPMAPRIVTQPGSQTVAVDRTVTFSVVAEGAGPLTYQWQRGGVPVDGATAPSYSFIARDADHESAWTVRVGNVAGTVISAPAVLAVNVGTLSVVAGAISPLTFTEYVDGVGAAARFSGAGALAVDAQGAVYVADRGANTIRKVQPDGRVSTLAGQPNTPFDPQKPMGDRVADGLGSAARFLRPGGLAFGPDGLLYVVDGFELTMPLALVWQRLRSVSPTGEVRTVDQLTTRNPTVFVNGGGTIHVASLGGPVQTLRPGATLAFNPPANHQVLALTGDAAGALYIVGLQNVYRRDPDGRVTILAGPELGVGSSAEGFTDGVGSAASFRFRLTSAIVSDSVGNLYVLDPGNHAVRRVAPDGTVKTIVGQPGVSEVRTGRLPGGLSSPTGLALLNDKTLYVTSANALLKIELP